jgi:hypothetical protein
VLVPVTTVNENHLAMPRKYEIGFASKISAVKAITVTHAMYQGPDE